MKDEAVTLRLKPQQWPAFAQSHRRYVEMSISHCFDWSRVPHKKAQRRKRADHMDLGLEIHCCCSGAHKIRDGKYFLFSFAQLSFLKVMYVPCTKSSLLGMRFSVILGD